MYRDPNDPGVSASSEFEASARPKPTWGRQWTQIGRARDRVWDNADNIVMLSDVFKVFEPAPGQELEGLSLAVMASRLQIMEMLLTFANLGKKPLFSLPRNNVPQDDKGYLLRLFKPEENENPLGGIGAIEAGQDMVADWRMQFRLGDGENEAAKHNEELARRMNNRFNTLFGRSPKFTPCFYLGDIMNVLARNFLDRNLKMQQTFEMLRGRGPAFEEIMLRLSKLPDYSRYFPDHPRMGKGPRGGKRQKNWFRLPEFLTQGAGTHATSGAGRGVALAPIPVRANRHP